MEVAAAGRNGGTQSWSCAGEAKGQCCWVGRAIQLFDETLEWPWRLVLWEDCIVFLRTISFLDLWPSSRCFSDSCFYRCIVIGTHRRSLRWALGHLKRYHVEVHPSRVLISVLLGPRLLHRDIAMKTVVNLSTPRKLVPHFHSKAAGWGKSRCAAQEAEAKRQSEVCWRKQRRCRSWKSWDGPPSRGE